MADEKKVKKTKKKVEDENTFWVKTRLEFGLWFRFSSSSVTLHWFCDLVDPLLRV